MLKFPAAPRRPRLSATEVTGTTVDASPAPAGPETPPRTPWTRLDRLCLAILVLVPTVGFSVPAALGYPVVPGDEGPDELRELVTIDQEARLVAIGILD